MSKFLSMGKGTKKAKKKETREEYARFLNGLEIAKADCPTNLCAKYLSRDLFNSFAPKEQDLLYKCCKPGFENPQTTVGCFAMTPTDYTTFQAFFDPVIREYHKAERDAVHTSDWDISGAGDKGVMDTTKQQVGETTMRVSVSRSLVGFNLPGNMTKDDRIQLEKRLMKAFEKLISMRDYGGQVYSLTPDFGGKKNPNPNLVNEDDYAMLLEKRQIFENAEADPLLKSAGIADDWPYGRGCYISADSRFIVWYGEEDHLKIISTRTGTRLDEVFNHLKDGLKVLESTQGIQFVVDNAYGYLTSSPANLGTGMQASVHMKLANLTRGGKDISKAKLVCDALGFNVQPANGEDIGMGPEGLVEVSTKARLFVPEKDIVSKLFDGMKLIMIDEKAAIIYRSPQSSYELLERNKNYDNQRYTSDTLPFGLLIPGISPKKLEEGRKRQETGQHENPETTEAVPTPTELGKARKQRAKPNPKATVSPVASSFEEIVMEDNPEVNFAEKFLNHIDTSPTPFHCCAQLAFQLERAGFLRIKENVPWKYNQLLKLGGRYFFLRGGSTLVAFTIGYKYKPGEPFMICGAHTDSSVLKIKPNNHLSKEGWMQVNVECYGGGLWHTWLDRDLGVAGRVIIKTADGYRQQMVHINRPLLRVPSLAIHLQDAKERQALALNLEDNLKPIIGLVTAELNQASANQQNSPLLLRELSKELKCKVEDIVDLELLLCDTQPSAIGGANGEFIFASRLDNQIHSFTSIEALINYSSSGLLKRDSHVSMCCLFDHEEVGSESTNGAGSPLLADTVSRINGCFQDESDEEFTKVTFARSIIISADCAHGTHPNYSSKHDPAHKPVLGRGTVVKTNSNQRYATGSASAFVVREVCRRNNIPFQEFTVRNDMTCGSTIGPILAAGTGTRTVDVGVPQLSMHSIREMCAVKDIYTNCQLLTACFAEGLKVEGSLNIEERVLKPQALVRNQSVSQLL